MATDDYPKIEHDMAAMLREPFPVTWPPGLATKLSLQIPAASIPPPPSGIPRAFEKNVQMPSPAGNFCWQVPPPPVPTMMVKCPAPSPSD